MRDDELLRFFINLDPESELQKKLRSEAMKTLAGVSESVAVYFHDLAFDEVEGKLLDDIYAHYSHWCSRNNYKIENRAVVGKYIKQTYNVEPVREWFEDSGDTKKLKTVYRWR